MSVVVACNGAHGALERFLHTLWPQRDDAEVVACAPSAPGAALRDAFPDVRWHVRERALVPVLWRDGIDQATGDLVALTISPMIPRNGWLAGLRRALASADAVGGAVEPGPGLRLSDLAECLCRYADDMLPFAAGPSLDLPGDNAGYRRSSLLAVGDAWADGFWEPEVHRSMAGRGDTLVRDPTVVVEMGRSAGAAAFLRQRVTHARVYGRSRGARFGVARNVAGVVGSPLVPLVLVRRTMREARARGRGRDVVRTLPFLVAYDVAWALGEAAGHLDAIR